MIMGRRRGHFKSKISQNGKRSFLRLPVLCSAKPHNRQLGIEGHLLWDSGYQGLLSSNLHLGITLKYD